MSAKARILIVTNGPLARNPRVIKEATALGNAGYEVAVLTPRNHAPSEPFDLAICAGAPFRRLPVDLIPGFGLSRWRIFWRLLPHRVGREAMARFGIENLHSLGPARLLLRLAQAETADLTIVHNEVPHGVGLKLLARGRRVAADIEDWHSEDLPPEARRARPLGILRQQERQLLQSAAYCTTTSEAMAEALHQRYGGTRPVVITNSFPLGPCRQPTEQSGAPLLMWFSQTVGPGRGLEEFLDTWGRTKRLSQLILVGEDRDGYLAQLRGRLPSSHRNRLQHRPLVSPTELPGLIADHDIGLALERSSPPNKNLTISNKILQYLNAGLAVVATPTAGQREVLAHSPDAGVLVDFTCSERAAETLDNLLADRAALKNRQRAARELAESRYNWTHEKARLLSLVEHALAAPRSGTGSVSRS